jgi:hypothetical protein
VGADDGAFVIDALRDSIEALRTSNTAGPYDPNAEPPVLLMGVPGRDPLDELVLELARVLLREDPAIIEVLPTDMMTGEALAAIEAKAPAAVIVPSLPPAGLTPARHLCMRLHARIPALSLVGARLGDPEAEVTERAAMLETAGCTEVAPTLAALKSTLQRIVRAAMHGVPVKSKPVVAANQGR